ncbi:uncharacterized protein LOC105436552 [Strongylocentrotus purpuratus]|uniref:Uncharacterized protein n=1 Tax=Strongylocentrotus purpuratus TaxID=7668 RepID=A0A7M7NFV2_STRPU|nr:uncharacterized protein LOC105436552 [Strongylocentrotus purpuratus]
MKVQIIKLDGPQYPTPATSHHLAEALCSMPNLTDLTLGRNLHEEFYTTLTAKAPTIQILKFDVVKGPTPASLHDLAEALCSMPNLTDLTLGSILNKEFCSTLKAKASSIQVQILKLDVPQCPTPASSHDLAEALCSMPNLTDMTLEGINISEEFYSTLKVKASSIQGCFPQIRKGNFRFNAVAQNDLDSFLHAVTLQSPRRLDRKVQKGY